MCVLGCGLKCVTIKKSFKTPVGAWHSKDGETRDWLWWLLPGATCPLQTWPPPSCFGCLRVSRQDHAHRHHTLWPSARVLGCGRGELEPKRVTFKIGSFPGLFFPSFFSLFLFQLLVLVAPSPSPVPSKAKSSSSETESLSLHTVYSPSLGPSPHAEESK